MLLRRSGTHLRTHFTRSAEIRNVSQAALGHRVQAHEQWVRAKSIDRTACRLRLRPTGACFRAVASGRLNPIEKSKYEIGDAPLRNPLRKTVRAGHKKVVLSGGRHEAVPAMHLRARCVVGVWPCAAPVGARCNTMTCFPFLCRSSVPLKPTQPAACHPPSQL